MTDHLQRVHRKAVCVSVLFMSLREKKNLKQDYSNKKWHLEQQPYPSGITHVRHGWCFAFLSTVERQEGEGKEGGRSSVRTETGQSKSCFWTLVLMTQQQWTYRTFRSWLFFCTLNSLTDTWTHLHTWLTSLKSTWRFTVLSAKLVCSGNQEVKHPCAQMGAINPAITCRDVWTTFSQKDLNGLRPPVCKAAVVAIKPGKTSEYRRAFISGGQICYEQQHSSRFRTEK